MTINLSSMKLNTVDNTDTGTISASVFVFIHSLVVTRVPGRGWLCDYPPKKPSVAYLMTELFNIGIPVVQMDCRRRSLPFIFSFFVYFDNLEQ